MTDKGILFSAPMVRALIREVERPGEGKTQTRRGLKGGALAAHEPDWKAKRVNGVWWLMADTANVRGSIAPSLRIAVGDRLYVREAWRVSKNYDHFAPVTPKPGTPALLPRTMTVMFEAGGSIANQASGRWEPDNGYPSRDPVIMPDWAGKFRQGMHMPRWASRLTLTVSEVRIERLQDISEGDAQAEGITFARFAKDGTGPSFAAGYAKLWDDINGPGAWALNPWVAASTFSVALGNIDA